MSRVNAITCAAWVPRGYAKEDPDKVEVTKEELEKIIKQTKVDVDDLEEDDYEKLEKNENSSKEKLKSEADKENIDEEEESETEMEAETCASESTSKVKSPKVDTEDTDMEDDDNDNTAETDDIVTAYNLNNYDDDNTDTYSLGKYVVHASGEEDPYLTVKDDQDSDSEDGNYKILKNDNLVAVGHVDDDAAILEVHVYNSEEGSFYVHHDILLPAIPLCMEWLNYDPSEETPGNLLAVGSMSNVIEVWDLDLVDVLEPAYKLGNKGKKKKKLAKSGHKDAVLCLAWNKEYFHILASGSVDQTVILWDLKDGRVDRQISCFNEKVQALQWHPSEPHHLLAGSCDKIVKMFDFRSDDSVKSWEVDGEVECIQWNPTVNEQFLVSTDTGSVYLMDNRKKKPLWNLSAHEEAVTGLKMSPTCPGCLVTASVDTTMKIWDISQKEPLLVTEHQPKLGIIHSLSSCPDNPFVFFMGGDNGEHNHKVLDIRNLGLTVRGTFCERIGLPIDADLEDDTEETLTAMENISLSSQNNTSVSIVEENAAKGWKPKKTKFKKKKGGHLDKKKKA